MSPQRVTTIRLSEELQAGLDSAGERLGVPLNSLISFACMEWLEHHPGGLPAPASAKVSRIPGRVAEVFSRGADKSRRRALCSFCGKPQEKVDSLVAGPGVYICDSCVDLCIDVLDSEPAQELPVGAEAFNLGDEARSLLLRAARVARHAGNPFLGTEHIVMAMMQLEGSRPWRALTGLGVSKDMVREGLAANEMRAAGRHPKRMELTSRALTVLQVAAAESGSAGRAEITADDVLVAILAEGQGLGAGILTAAGVTRASVLKALSGLDQDHDKPATTPPLSLD